jgi:Fe-S-cluster-containing dehydrogenase component/anaerobic selenocysteine-containing dehydrogenase
MNRRDFLKTLSFGGSVSALSACGVDDNIYYTPIEQYLPYVTRPEQVTPGTNTNFATSIGKGPRAWPTVAVHRDGRVINVGANKLAPANVAPPAVPTDALLELQRHYSPDRIQGPRKGEGAAKSPVAWQEALGEFGTAVKAARDGGKRVVFLSGYRGGTIVELIRSFTNNDAIFWEPLGMDAEALAATALFGEGGLPRYNPANATLILSFGAPFLSNAWGNPAVQTGYSRARHAQGDSVARFVAITPHQDQTAANADSWYPCVPGTEAEVAMAIAKLVAEGAGYQGPARALLDQVDVGRASQVSGVPQDVITGLVALFKTGSAICLPGGTGGASKAATRLAAATYLINALRDDPELFSGGGYRGPVSSYAEVEKLIADMEAGQVGVLIVDDADPVYTLPQGERFAAAMGKVALTVSTSSHPSETGLAAKLVLPTHDPFEDWGDEEPWAGFRLLRQPAQAPMYDTQALGDLLLATWRAADAATASPLSWRDWLKSRWAETVYRTPAEGELAEGEAPPAPIAPVAYDSVEFRRFWEDKLIAGFHETRVRRRLEVLGTPEALATVLGGGASPGDGSPAGEGEYYLQVFPHAFYLDGRYANEPWAHEVPDPMTGHVWDSWVLVHPQTAEKLNVDDRDLVTIKSATGEITVGVEIHPCVRPDVVAIPMGGGHTAASGRYAEQVGVNVMKLLAPVQDASGALALQQTKVSVTKAGGRSEQVSTFGHDTDSNRNFVAVVDAGEWAKVGDAPSEHPGDLTGIHHLPMDKRLVEREIAWRQQNPQAEPEKTAYLGFYPVPDHPTYRFAMTIDTNSCVGCSACVVACYAENNLPVVGKWKIKQRREMSWIRINRYFANHTEDGSPSVHFVPMLCQHCGHAPCESVCPVLATYHSIDGLNAMVYNRCVGTRYCSNACPYSVRRFNYHSYVWPEPFNLQLNPDVTARTMGVMEKCTFCVQRIRRTKSAFRDLGFTTTVPDEQLRQLTACAEACPTQAITFGNLVDPESTPAKTRKSGRNYMILAELNTYPAINYLARASFHVRRAHSSGHGGSHGTESHAEKAHGEQPHGAPAHTEKTPGEHQNENGAGGH